MPLNWQLITEETLSSLDLDSLLQGFTDLDCLSFQSVISRLEKEDGRWSPAQLEGLRFIGASLSMMLHADQPSEPFGPMFVMGGRRSAIPTDFPKDNLRELLAWALTLKDPEIRARLLDLIWIQARSFPAALGAIDAYLESALRLESPTDWSKCLERLERSLRLSAGLGKGGAELRLKVLNEIEAMLHRHKGKDPLYLTLRLTRLLLEFKHGEPRQYAEYAHVAATIADAEKNYWRAKDYYQLAADCLRAAGDVEGESAALRDSAESLVKESDLARIQTGRGAMTAASILSDAVEAMRQAPGGRERATELHDHLLKLQKESLDDFKPISTSIDLTKMVINARAAVRNKSLHDAVITLIRMAQPPSIEKLIRDVKDQARVSILGSMISSEIVNSRGRVVARAPGLDDAADDPKHDGLRWRMFSTARLGRGLTVQGALDPARTEILAAHFPDRIDILGLIQHSPWIPPGHLESVLRALVAGFHGDMLVASHLVIPQLEAIIRHVVESMGGATSMLEPGGVQPERPLGVLLETPQALQVFGADGIFELQGLLVDPLGTNLRNEVAHGLIDDEGLFGTDAIFAWWLLLRYCVMTSKIVQRESSASAST
ncbi:MULTISPECIES: DUF4209 domain-containing protein [unclassified Pseudomonas]|uniref:DUF4209 domain-containing protein n=1 Tax=unclassified Pseudomonas TaxID=196821 RepID=UPI000451B305|nr:MULTISPECIES: DUF4209 domain-containing protein [unclassified Pseudomonas]EZP32677.1 hypothetical protein BW33_01540 [Pseudomonas sp. RIT288]